MIFQEREMNSALDLEKWSSDLSFQEQDLMKKKYLGFATSEVAAHHDLGYQVCYRKIQDLGMDLAQRAGIRIAPRKRRQRKAS